MSNRDKDTPKPPAGGNDSSPAEQDSLEKEFFDGEERTLRELREEAEREAGTARGGGAGADGEADDEEWVDGEEELRRIMAPRKSARHPLLALAVIGASLYGMWWLRDDLRYFLRSRAPVQLGPAPQALAQGRLEHNTFVTLEGMPVSQSVASGKQRSLLGGSADQRLQWFLLAGTGNQVLVRQLVTPVNPRSQALPKTSPRIRGTFTGRLRLLRHTESNRLIRSSYLRMSKESPMLRPFHRVTGAEILQKVGRPGAALKDIEGETFRVDQDTLLEMFVTFPGEYELDIHTDQKSEIKADIVKGKKIRALEVTAGDGAPTCGLAQPWPGGSGPTGSAAGGSGQPAKAPGAKAPGAKAPGAMVPGAMAPGAKAPVAKAPGAKAPVAKAPVAKAPVAKAPGAKAPGAKAPVAATGRSRRTGWGGSIFLRDDPKVFLLDDLAAEGVLEAPSGKAGTPPESGRDRVLPVPPGTKVFNTKRRDCKHACRWEGPACLKGCSVEPHIEITRVGGQIFLAAGGDCGGGKGERHEVSLSVLPFPNAARAVAYVESLGYPFILSEDHSKTTQTVRFIVKMPEAAARALVKRQQKRSPYTISPRFEVFRVRWEDLRRQGGELVISRTRRGYAAAHEVVVKDGKRLLRPVPIGPTLRLAASRVVKADITQLLKLPEDTYVLEVGVRPSDMWREPFLPGVPVFYLLLLVFIVLNGFAIRSYFRK